MFYLQQLDMLNLRGRSKVTRRSDIATRRSDFQAEQSGTSMSVEEVEDMSDEKIDGRRSAKYRLIGYKGSDCKSHPEPMHKPKPDPTPT